MKDLVDSISQAYPCGSLILWEPREKDHSLVRSMVRPERLEQYPTVKTPRSERSLHYGLQFRRAVAILAGMILALESRWALLGERPPRDSVRPRAPRDFDKAHIDPIFLGNTLAVDQRLAWNKILSTCMAMAFGHHSRDARAPRRDALRDVRDLRIKPHLIPRPFRQPFPLHRRLSKSKGPCRLETCSSENYASGVPAGDDAGSVLSVPTNRRGVQSVCYHLQAWSGSEKECVIPAAIHSIDSICT